MIGNWLKTLFAPKTRPLTAGRRVARSPQPAFRPAVLGLEDRLAPAVVGTLSLVGNTLWYNGTSANNVVTVSGTAATLTVTDAAGQITVAPSVGSGFAGGGTGTITGAIPSNVTQFIVNGQAGTDIVSIGAANLTTTASVQFLGEVINVNGDVTASGINLQPNAGGVITLATGADLSTAGTPNAGDITLNGIVSLAAGDHTVTTDGVTDGNITFMSTVSGPGGLSVNSGGLTGAMNTGGNFTANGLMNFSGAFAFGTVAGVPGANSIAFSKAVNATGAVSLRAFNAIKLGGNLTSGGRVVIQANQDGAGSEGFIQTAGDIVTANAGTPGTAGILLEVNPTITGGTGGATVRGLTVGTGGTIEIRTSSPAGGGAIVDGNGAGVLNANTGAGGTVAAVSGNGGLSLDTFTANLVGLVGAGSGTGNAAVRNSGLDLTVTTLRTGTGNVTLTNNLSHSIVLAGIVGATVAGDASISTGVVGTGTGTITQTGGTVRGNKVTLTARDSIGATGTEVVVRAPVITDTVSLRASTSQTAANAGIFVSSTSPLNVLGATANAGNIGLFTNVASGNLTVNGAVATAAGGTVALQTKLATSNIDINTGSVTSNSGAITITPTQNFRTAAGTNVATGGTVGVDLSATTTVDALIDIAGDITGTGNVTIAGVGGTKATTLSIGGAVASGAALSITSAGTGITTYALGGSLGSGTTTTISGAGLTNLVMNGTVTSSGATTISAGTTASVIMTLSGTLNSAGAVDINGASTTGTTFLNLTGPLTSGGAVTIDGGTTGALILNQSGAVTGTTVTVTGSTAAANVLTLGGPVTASTGAITVTTATDTVGSFVYITGKMAAATTTNVIGATAAVSDYFVVAPSTASTFTFTFGAAAADTLVIQAPLSSILAADAGFTAPITFTAASGFQTWTKTAGLVNVTPTVP